MKTKTAKLSKVAVKDQDVAARKARKVKGGFIWFEQAAPAASKFGPVQLGPVDLKFQKV